MATSPCILTELLGGGDPTSVSDCSKPRLCCLLLHSYFPLEFSPRENIPPAMSTDATILASAQSSVHLGDSHLCPRIMLLRCITMGPSDHLSIALILCICPLSCHPFVVALYLLISPLVTPSGFPLPLLPCIYL